jgi:torulene dioxygenase
MNHMVMHHVNAYDDPKTGDIVLDVSAHDNCEGLFHGPTGQHGNLAVMRDPEARDKVATWGSLRTFQISGTSLKHWDTPLRDSEGYVYQFDFPYVNPKYASNYNKFFWGVSAYARNSTHYADWAVVKVDREATGVNTQAWFKQGHVPAEPVFVPRPGATAEDDGVLLVQTSDGVQQRGYLLILDAATMKEIGTASLDAGEHLPYSQHGRWYDTTSSETMIVSV